MEPGEHCIGKVLVDFDSIGEKRIDVEIESAIGENEEGNNKFSVSVNMRTTPGKYGGDCLAGNQCDYDWLMCYNGKCKPDHTDPTEALIIDSHVHFDSRFTNNLGQLVTTMNQNGVDRAALVGGCGYDDDIIEFGEPHGGLEGDNAIWNAYRQYPNKFWPCLDTFVADEQDAVSYVSDQLQKRKWRCIGEVYLRIKTPGADLKIPANNPVMMQIYQLAAQYDIPVFIHFEPTWGVPIEQGLSEVYDAVASNPNTTFVWFHGCSSNDSARNNNFPNLWCSEDVLYPHEHNGDPFHANTLGIGSDIGCADITSTPDGRSYNFFITQVRNIFTEEMPGALAIQIAYERMWELMGGF